MKIRDNAMGRIRLTLDEINDGIVGKSADERAIAPETKKLAEAVAMGVLAASEEIAFNR